MELVGLALSVISEEKLYRLGFFSLFCGVGHYVPLDILISSSEYHSGIFWCFIQKCQMLGISNYGGLWMAVDVEKSRILFSGKGISTFSIK